MNPDRETYGYDNAFQIGIASLFLRDITFMKDYSDVIDPRYFDNKSLVSIIRIGKSCFEKNGEIPSKSLLVEEVKEFCSSYKLPKSDSEDILLTIDQIYDNNIVDSNAIREKVIKFGRRQAMRYALMNIADIVDSDPDYNYEEKVDNIIENALRVGYNANDLGLSLTEKIDNIQNLAKRDNRFIYKIKTGIRTFDLKNGGGIGRGEIWVVLGLSGRGKSQFLVNMGSTAIEEGVSVVHITVGDLEEEDVGLRYAARLTRCKIVDILKNDEIFIRRAKKIKSSFTAYLRIKYYDPGTITVGHIKAYLSKVYSKEGFKPGLLILDYPDEFKKKKNDNDYQAMGDIFSEVKTLIKQYNCGCWAASQINRWIPRHKNDVITCNNISDSSKKVHKADGIVSFNQTYEESKANKARLWCDKNRRGPKYYLIPLEVDWSSSTIKEGVLEDSEYDKDRQ